MGYSQIIFSSLALTDITPPGVPQLALARTANREIEARVTLPSEDSDGSQITGLAELVVALLPETVSTENPFDGIAAENLASFAEGNGGQSSTIFLTDDDAGQIKATRFGALTIGKVYWVAAAVRDDA
jgi:hypothetical protein